MNKPVLVTTTNRGVFFGYLASTDAPAKLTIGNARCCVSWSMETHGFLGLASKGPDKDYRIGPRVPSLTLYGITSVTDCTTDAAAQWEAEHWG